MDKIKEIVDSKLKKYKLTPFNMLEKKTQENLIEIEQVIVNTEITIKDLIKDIKNLRLNVSRVANKVSFVRKTIYNNELLKLYIEKSIEDEEDYFNEKGMRQLKAEINTIKNHYSNVIEHIIRTNLLEKQVSDYKKEINYLIETNEKLESINADKYMSDRRLENDIKPIDIKELQAKKNS